MKNKKLAIEVPILARVEGEGALFLEISGGQITQLQLKIYEPPRLFEKFLVTRSCEEVLDIVARICGICPVAYQMSAVAAIENCFKLEVGPWVKELRRLFYCGEWLESHSMHIHFLALPDFLGFDTAPLMGKAYPEELRRGLRLQAFGNDLVKLLGGRSVHPVGAKIGGFYKAPAQAEIKNLLARTTQLIEDCQNLITWLSKIIKIDNSHDFMSVALYHPQEYAITEGRIVSDQGLDIEISNFSEHFTEYQVPYSNALHCKLAGKNYLVGPLARMNLSHQHLPEKIKDLLANLGIKFPSKNMYHSIIARAVEIYYAVLEAQRILSSYQEPAAPSLEYEYQAGIGYGCTEAPRGMLWHSYQIDQAGKILEAKIVPPTSQNQARIEDDLRISLEKFGLDQAEDSLRKYSEMLIRNYDPCISCATHFLSLQVKQQ